MEIEWKVVLALALVFGMLGALWSAMRIERQQIRAIEILDRNAEQQRLYDVMYQRQIDLISRWEAVVSRLEGVMTRWEDRPDR